MEGRLSLQGSQPFVVASPSHPLYRAHSKKDLFPTLECLSNRLLLQLAETDNRRLEVQAWQETKDFII